MNQPDIATTKKKTAGVMQPYFFPYLGYFSLIKHTDPFVLLDPVQFIRHGWITRNRVLKPGGDWQYIGVPLDKKAYHLDTLIKDARISNATDWKQKIIAQLEHYKKRAPFYRQTIELVREALSVETDSYVTLNSHILSTVSRYLNIPHNILVFSDLNLPVEPANDSDEWALNICRALDGVDEYWNPPGGMTFYSREKYQEHGIRLRFQKMNLPPYRQLREDQPFEPGLSIVDVMMFSSPEEINAMLDDYELL